MRLTLAQKGSLRLWPVSGRLGQDLLSGTMEDQGAHARVHGMLHSCEKEKRLALGCPDG